MKMSSANEKYRNGENHQPASAKCGNNGGVMAANES
jgi:hypothetical protein